MSRPLLLILIMALASVVWLLLDGDMLGDLFGVASESATAMTDLEILTAESDATEEAPAVMLQGFGPSVKAERDNDKTSALDALLKASGQFAKVATGATTPFRAHVVDVDGDAIADVDITIDGTDHVSRNVTKTDEEGAFDIDLPAGRYDLLFESETAGALVVRNYIHDGAADQDKVFTLRERATLRVFAKQGGKPLRGAVVMVERHTRTPMAPVRSGLVELDDINSGPADLPPIEFTDGQGRATFEGLPVDRYEITVTLEPTTVTLEPSRIETSKKVITQQNRDALDQGDGRHPPQRPQDRQAQGEHSGEQGRTKGRCHDGRFRTKARGTSGVLESIYMIDDSGDFEIDVLAGRVDSISVHATGRASWPEPHQRKSIRRKLAGLARGKGARLDIVLGEGRALTGKVLTQDREPVPGVTLRFQGRYADAAVEATSDQEGVYRVSELTADRYDMSIVNQGVYPLADQRSRFTIPRNLAKAVRVRRARRVGQNIARRGRVLRRRTSSCRPCVDRGWRSERAQCPQCRA